MCYSASQIAPSQPLIELWTTTALGCEAVQMMRQAARLKLWHRCCGLETQGERDGPQGRAWGGRLWGRTGPSGSAVGEWWCMVVHGGGWWWMVVDGG